MDDVFIQDGFEFDVERRVVPEKRPVYGLLAPQTAHLTIHDASIANKTLRVMAPATQPNDPGRTCAVDVLQEIRESNVARRSAPLAPPRPREDPSVRRFSCPVHEQQANA